MFLKIRVDERILNENNIIDIRDEYAFEVIGIAPQEVVVDEVPKNIWIESRLIGHLLEWDEVIFKSLARCFCEIVVKYS